MPPGCHPGPRTECLHELEAMPRPDARVYVRIGLSTIRIKHAWERRRYESYTILAELAGTVRKPGERAALRRCHGCITTFDTSSASANSLRAPRTVLLHPLKQGLHASWRPGGYGLLFHIRIVSMPANWLSRARDAVPGRYPPIPALPAFASRRTHGNIVLHEAPLSLIGSPDAPLLAPEERSLSCSTETLLRTVAGFHHIFSWIRAFHSPTLHSTQYAQLATLTIQACQSLSVGG